MNRKPSAEHYRYVRALEEAFHQLHFGRWQRSSASVLQGFCTAISPAAIEARLVACALAQSLHIARTVSGSAAIETGSRRVFGGSPVLNALRGRRTYGQLPHRFPGWFGGEAMVTKMPTITKPIESLLTKLPLMLEKK
jgi:hypothetical protein